MEKTRVTKYMTFQFGGRTPIAETAIWIVKSNESGDILATIFRYAPWHQYVIGNIVTTSASVFNSDCLDDISKFLTELNQGHIIVPRKEVDGITARDALLSLLSTIRDRLT